MSTLKSKRTGGPVHLVRGPAPTDSLVAVVDEFRAGYGRLIGELLPERDEAREELRLYDELESQGLRWRRQGLEWRAVRDGSDAGTERAQASTDRTFDSG